MIHPIISKRRRFVLYWLIWLIIGLAQSLLMIFSSDISATAAFSDGLFSAIIFALLAVALWFPLNQLSSGSRDPLIISINHLSLALITLAIWIFLTKFLVLSLLPDKLAYKSFWEKSIYYRLGAGAFIYAVVTLAYYLMISIDNLAKKEMREARLENMLKETELMMLRSQINPHFLFNSLNSISALTISDPEKAREMVIKLSDFMRYALSRKDDRAVSLATELENLRLYLEIEKTRFGDKLLIEENVEDKCLKLKIPNMILQPLYENAIKHGVYESTEAVCVRLRAECDADAMLISLSNNFDPDSIPAEGTGTGLENISRRLELYYGSKSWMKTTKENNIFTVSLFIPRQADLKI